MKHLIVVLFALLLFSCNEKPKEKFVIKDTAELVGYVNGFVREYDFKTNEDKFKPITSIHLLNISDKVLEDVVKKSNLNFKYKIGSKSYPVKETKQLPSFIRSASNGLIVIEANVSINYSSIYKDKADVRLLVYIKDKLIRNLKVKNQVIQYDDITRMEWK